MRIIGRASYFCLCADCGCHGHIVCADETESKEFATKAGGLKELKAFVLSKRVAEDEALEIRRQIEESELEYDNPNLERVLERLDQMKVKLREVLDEFHREIKGVLIQTGGKDPNRTKKITLH